jgi:hypothetical protein
MFSRITKQFATNGLRPIQKHVGIPKSFTMPKRMFSAAKSSKPISWTICGILVVFPVAYLACNDYYYKKRQEDYSNIRKLEAIEIKDKMDAELTCSEDADIQTKIDINIIKADIRQFAKLKNKTEQICLYVIKRQPRDIVHIENPSNAVCMEALKANPALIASIKNPTNEMITFAIQQKPEVIKYVDKKHLTNDIIMMAIELNPRNIKYLDNPDEKMCWSVIRRDPNSIAYIQKDRVTKEMQLEALNLGAIRINHYADKCTCGDAGDLYSSACAYHLSKYDSD